MTQFWAFSGGASRKLSQLMTFQASFYHSELQIRIIFIDSYSTPAGYCNECAMYNTQFLPFVRYTKYRPLLVNLKICGLHASLINVNLNDNFSTGVPLP